MSARMKTLVFGFSVTGDTPGYVEFWQRDHAASHPDMTLQKIAIGGLQPGMGRHLIPLMLERYQPDLAVFELVTPVYRLRPPTGWIVNDHTQTVNFIVGLCAERNIRCGFLDLPQENIDPAIDWIPAIHAEILGRCGIPNVIRDLAPDTLRDNVHPNDTGRKLYADALEELIGRMLESDTSNYGLAAQTVYYDAFHFSDLDYAGGVIADFERNGFETEVLQLEARESVRLKLPAPLKVVGAPDRVHGCSDERRGADHQLLRPALLLPAHGWPVDIRQAYR